MRSIEKLVIWLIPAELLGIIFNVVFTQLRAFETIDHGSRTLISIFAVLSGLSYLIGQAVIGIWLYQRPHRTDRARWIWSIFGLCGGFWSLALYLLLQVPSISTALDDLRQGNANL